MSTIIQKIFKPGFDSKSIEKAFKFAKTAHASQKRLSGDEYIQHPARVAQILKEMHLDSKTIIAGLLHDVPDDTEKNLEDIEKEFGKEVAFLVEGVSKLGKLRYPKERLEVKPMEERVGEPIDLKAENLRKMFFAMAEDLRVVLIKLADRLHNMETLGSLPPEKQKRIALETLEIYAPLADRLGMGEMKAKLEDLAFPYLYPKEYEWLIQNVKEKYEKRKKYLEKLQPILKELLRKEKIKLLEISSRAKSYWSLYQKLLKYEMNFDRIHDLIALRVVVEDVKTCYEVLGIIHKFWKPLPGKIKDFIAFPKPNNYQALHTTCFCLDGKITEIQIKTKAMHQEAENGICAHWAMKEGIDLKTQGKKFAWVQQLRDWQREVSKSKEFLEGLKIDFFKNRIFVFTPKGDVIDLPEGASPVDFAYAVHSDIGNQCAGAKINGKMSSLSQPLNNGDVVEIITDKNKKPSRDWLEFIKTSFARTRVKRWLKSESRPQNIDRGLKLLNQEFQRMKGITFENLSQPKKEELLKVFPYKNLENLIVAVGEGEVSAKEIFKKLFKEEEILIPTPKVSPRLHWEQIQRKGKEEISLAGERGIKTYLAKCCCPQPGDEIRAWITKERGASIHKTNCENLIQAQKKCPQRIIEASWPSREKMSYTASLAIEAEDRIGLFRDISSAISALGINILNFQAESPKEKLATLKANVEISDWEDLDKLFGQLKQVKGVLEVRKI